MRSVRSEAGVSVEAAKLAKLARRLKAASRFAASPLPSLWFLTDDDREPDPLAAARLLPPGTGIILRHYRAQNREGLAFTLAEIAHARNLVLLIGADGTLATRTGAHGVHIPRWAAARRAGPKARGIITASAHGPDELRRAQAIGADGVFLGPVFPTESHKSAQGLGPVRISAIAHKSRLPVLALGGVTAANAGLLQGSGAAGIGAIGALLPPTDNKEE